MMKFNIELVSKSSGRLGVLKKDSSFTMKTPGVIMATKVSGFIQKSDFTNDLEIISLSVRKPAISVQGGVRHGHAL